MKRKTVNFADYLNSIEAKLIPFSINTWNKNAPEEVNFFNALNGDLEVLSANAACIYEDYEEHFSTGRFLAPGIDGDYPLVDEEGLIQLANGEFGAGDFPYLNEMVDREQIYLYYFVNDSAAEQIIQDMAMPVFYSSLLDVYIVGVTTYGTAWMGVNIEIIDRD